MRILQLNFERGWRGGERQTLLCMQQFRNAGHDVALLARKGAALAAAARQDSFTVHEYKSVVGLCFFLLAHGRRFNILHSQTANTITWLAVFKWWLRRPIVFTRRTAFNVAQKRAQRTLWKWRKVDLFVAISEAAAAEPRRLGLAVKIIRSAIVPKLFNLEHAREFSARLGLHDKRVIATAAALTREKDPCTLIRAIHQLKQTRDDFLFVHLGAGGDTEFQAHQLVHELGLEQQYVFAGFQKEVEDLYRLMDVFVLSSREEALGSSVLDAFIYSVPVVSTNAGGLAETVGDGRGVLCQVGDHQAIADAIAKILDDADLREAVINKAQAYVRREHDAQEMARRYLAEFQRLGKL
ncbi:MAG TPA: glycosyltransferase family 4 protein [Eoetvoesiella sp.]